MSQELFNHPLLANQSVFRQFAKLVGEMARNEVVGRAEEYIIAVVDQAQDELEERIRNRPWTLIPLPGAGSNLQDLSTEELIDSVEVLKIPREQEHDLDSNHAAAVLSELAARPDDRDLITVSYTHLTLPTILLV